MSDLPTLPGSARPEEGGPEHDAWLREALRHAPDATAAPPLSLREAILAEARAATRTVPHSAPSISLVDRFAEFWSWLARPPVAAGFASVMAATLVGLMWWDRPMDEAMPQPRPPPVATTPAIPAATPAPAAALAPVADSAATTAAGTAPTHSDTVAARSAPPAAPAMPAAPVARATPTPSAATPAKRETAPAGPVPTDKLREAAKNGADIKDADEARPKTAAAAPAPFPARDRSDAETQRPAPPRAEPSTLARRAEKADASEQKEAPASEERLAAGLAGPAGAAPAGTVDRSASASNEVGAGGRVGAVRTLNQPVTVARQRAAEPGPATSATQAPAAAQPLAQAPAMAKAPAAARPMAPLLRSLASEGARWSRPGPGGDAALDAAVPAWLARVDTAATQWQPLAELLSVPDPSFPAAPAANMLLLKRDGRIAAIVRIDDGGVVFEPRPGPAWFAALAPDAIARLRATLPAAAAR